MIRIGMIERRQSRRARVQGLRASWQGAEGERSEGEVLDVNSGGVFVCTPSTVPAGKRLSMDLTLLKDGSTWSAVGRVVWAREVATNEEPSGMGVRFIDVDDDALAAIERLVAASPAISGEAAAPAREKTVLGLGLGNEQVAGARVPAAPARERTVLGVAPQATPETSRVPARPVAPSAPEPPPEDGWDAPLDQARPPGSPPPTAPAPSTHEPAEVVVAASPRLSPKPVRRRTPWFVALLGLLGLAALAVTGWAMRSRLALPMTGGAPEATIRGATPPPAGSVGWTDAAIPATPSNGIPAAPGKPGGRAPPNRAVPRSMPTR